MVDEGQPGPSTTETKLKSHPTPDAKKNSEGSNPARKALEKGGTPGDALNEIAKGKVPEGNDKQTPNIPKAEQTTTSSAAERAGDEAEEFLRKINEGEPVEPSVGEKIQQAEENQNKNPQGDQENPQNAEEFPGLKKLQDTMQSYGYTDQQIRDLTNTVTEHLRENPDKQFRWDIQTEIEKLIQLPPQDREPFQTQLEDEIRSIEEEAQNRELTDEERKKLQDDLSLKQVILEVLKALGRSLVNAMRS